MRPRKQIIKPLKDATFDKVIEAIGKYKPRKRSIRTINKSNRIKNER